MKRLNDYRMRLVFIGFVAVVVVGRIGGSAKADFTFGEPTNLGRTVNSAFGDISPNISADGLSLYFASERPGGFGVPDLFVTTRDTKEDEWAIPVNLGPTVNGPDWDYCPCISADGLTLYFASDRRRGVGCDDLHMSRRTTTNAPWGNPINLGPTVNSAAHDYSPSISADGLLLYFNSMRVGGLGEDDIYVSSRMTTNDLWSTPLNLGPPVNTTFSDSGAAMTADARMLFFNSTRPGGYGRPDIWMSKRVSTSGPWGEPINIGSTVNSSSLDLTPSISTDGTNLYFISNRPGGLGGCDIWQVSIDPVVDLNGDGIVDSADMCMIVDYWGTDMPLCDIGPMPWGDGIVDVQDLIILAEHLFEDYRLIAHWELDETEGCIACDSVQANDGTCHGEPLWVPAGGKMGGALQFDGIDDYISVPFVLDPCVGSFSVFTWLKGGTPGQVILSQANSTSGSNSTWLGIDPSTGKLMTRLSDPLFPRLESDSVITDGQWHHVGLVYNRDSLHRHLYVDGAEVARDMGPVGTIRADGGLYIAADEFLDVTSFFHGLIDDARIYNNVLSAKEIAALAR